MPTRASTPGEDAALSLTLAVVASSTAPLLLLDGDLKVVAASASFCRAFGIEPADPPGRAVFALGAGEWDVPELRAQLNAAVAGRVDHEALEMELRRRGREPRCLLVHADRLVYQDLDQTRLLLAVTDITQVRADEKRAEAMRQETALLLREVRHRIANSLQIIASVLLQEARRTRSDETRAHLKNAHHRVMSVAAMERQLSTSGDGDVQLGPYLRELCASISASMIHDPSLITLEVVAQDAAVDAKVSVCLGLIVTELVINALKHAFPERASGRITVGYERNGDDWALTVRDDGVGVSGRGTPGLGTSIVEALAQQLAATVAIDDARPGAAVSVVHGMRRPSRMQGVAPPRV